MEFTTHKLEKEDSSKKALLLLEVGQSKSFGRYAQVQLSELDGLIFLAT